MHASSEPRFRKRIPCQLQHGESSYSGVLLNLSRTGLFVQTSAAPRRGETVELKLRSGILVEAEAIWQRRVPQQLRSVSEGGVGLRIRNAPETYYTLLAEAAGMSTGARFAPGSPAPGQNLAAPASAKPRAKRELTDGAHAYRARVKRVDGPRSRTLEIRADSVAEAKARALAQAGEGWTIAEIDRA